MTTRMRAVHQRAFGGPEVLEMTEVPRPVAGPGEVLVQVHAAAVNPADWKRRSGQLRRFGEPPFTIGLDFAGTADGAEVFGVVLPPGGAYAEYVAAPAAALAPVPHGLDLVHAAALPTAGLTAWQSVVGAGGVRAGHRVLVHAAAGGVGHLAVQIAKARGAYVLGTARRERHGFLTELGVDEPIDYTATDFAAAARDIDVVIDPIAGDYGPRSLATLTPGGVLVDVRGTGPDRAEVRSLAHARGLRYVEFGFSPSGADLRELGALVQQGTQRVCVDRVLPLERAAEAHRLSEGGHVQGKLVLTT
ncbi:NADP-dependent oxidoreductase [Dactylosporangium sp. NPDC051485]|uniref:NADP-dependent oxidoreductase n=1 Tax=Dactylosporangium sp. NPDC051485 TaxID=3154846 RepID=UPI0034373BC0